MGAWLLIAPLAAFAADPSTAQPTVQKTVRQAAPTVRPPAETAESWLSVDETIRRTTFLPDDLRRQSPDTAAEERTSTRSAIEADADGYLAGLKEQRPFRGVYFISGAAVDADSGDTDYNYRLEWDLFKHGRYERKKALEKKRNTNTFQTLQMLDEVNQHHMNQQLDAIEFLSRTIQHHQAEELAALLADILRRRRVQLEKGYITRDDFDHIRFKYRQAELKKKRYGIARHATLDAALHEVLNCVESADLIALDQAQQAAVEQAFPLKIQQNLVERARYARSWSDDLSLNLYVEQRDDFNDTTRSNVGFEVKIPLHWDTKRGALIDREKRLYQHQAAVLTRRIKTNLEKLFDSFTFQQTRIQMLLLELEKSARRKAYERIRARRTLEDLDHTPERSLDQIRMEEIDLRYEAIQARLKSYEILVKIAALTHWEDPRALIAGTRTGCPAH